jgi:phosphonate transport system substrate-binding protein
MERHSFQRAFILSLALAVPGGCDRSDERSEPQYTSPPRTRDVEEYSVAIHPLHNPVRLTAAYQPLLSYLTHHFTGIRFTLQASRDYAAFERKYAERLPAFLLSNPWQTLQAMRHGYHVIAMAGDPADFKGLWIVRKDGVIQRPGDLKGKTVCYPSPTALAACIMPQYFLHTHGVDINNDITNMYVGSQESSIMNVYLGTAAAGATWPPPWRAFQLDHPKEAEALRVIWETSSLVNNAVMARDDVPIGLQDSICWLLLNLHATDEGRMILTGMQTARFLKASDHDYDVVRTYVKRFEHDVRTVETR